ncbi:MAG: amidohydrolase family protein [Anaerolineales bacterium]|nr:amidohydrolase family protein [Anaerolineales bacterium]
MDHALANLPLLDCHIHFGHPNYRPGLIDILGKQGVGKFNIVCTPHRARLSLVPDALLVKSQHPERTYVFGGLDISPLFMAPDTCGEMFAAYVGQLLDMGCDGIKMIEGKPDMRKMLPIPPFDSPVYEPYWAALEERGAPLIFHVNDPEEFWDAEQVPDWARAQGWFYGDGSFINNEAQYAEVLNVLERHPKLKVIFAHFFFLSAQLPRLAELLERFPNMCVDLTPGIEMYHNFSRDPDAARDFFLKYQERILFGTDIGAKALLSTPEMGIEADESALRIQIIRRFLEEEGQFQLDVDSGFLFGRFSGPFHGLGLPEEALRKIYCQNFERLAGSQPRALNPAAILAECERLAMLIPMMGAMQPDVPVDLSVVNRVKEHFANT